MTQAELFPEHATKYSKRTSGKKGASDRRLYNQAWRKTHPGYCHAYYLKTKEHQRVTHAAYNEVHKDQIKEIKLAYLKAHPEARDNQKALHHEWYLKNKEHVKAAVADYHKAHPEIRKNRSRVARAKRKLDMDFNFREWTRHTIKGHRARGCEILLTKIQLTDLARKSARCFYCGDALSWAYTGVRGGCRNSPTLDRLDSGKTLEVGNIVIACRLCNTTKGPRTHQEFIDYCELILRAHKKNA